jgi:hypothetical protein
MKKALMFQKTRKLDIVGSDKLGQVSLAHSLAQ